MKKILLIVVVGLLMSGCAAASFETVDDLNDVQAMAKPATLLLDLPEEAAAPAMEGTSGKLYFCGDYDISVEVNPSGNLDSTIKALTGFSKDELRLVKTRRCGVDCFESAWSAAGEAGDHVGRVLLLDDGSYHYCVSIMASAENAGAYADTWNDILESVALAES